MAITITNRWPLNDNANNQDVADAVGANPGTVINGTTASRHAQGPGGIWLSALDLRDDDAQGIQLTSGVPFGGAASGGISLWGKATLLGDSTFLGTTNNDFSGSEENMICWMFRQGVYRVDFFEFQGNELQLLEASWNTAQLFGWHHYLLIYSHTDGLYSFYIDNVLITADANLGNSAGGNFWRIGGESIK